MFPSCARSWYAEGGRRRPARRVHLSSGRTTVAVSSSSAMLFAEVVVCFEGFACLEIFAYECQTSYTTTGRVSAAPTFTSSSVITVVFASTSFTLVYCGFEEDHRHSVVAHLLDHSLLSIFLCRYHQRQNDYRYRSEIKSKTIGLYQITDVTDLY